jgi:D-serine deaminase-like pyridoxal phosphate-dependent protein
MSTAPTAAAAAAAAATPIVRRLSDLPTPAFVINRHAFVKNCCAVSEMAKDRKLRLRPHIKTHKTVQGAWIQVHGAAPMVPTKQQNNANLEKSTSNTVVTGFVASTIPEISLLVEAVQEYYPNLPLDILYGIPISASKLPIVYQLRQTLMDSTAACLRDEEQGEKSAVPATIHILMDHLQQVTMVEDFLKTTPQTAPLSVFVKLDTGYHRAGITCDERGIRLIERILESPMLDLKGVYTHW